MLDRDGVINRESDEFIKSPAEWLPIAGSLEAIGLLTQHGFTVAVASNQSGIGRRLLDRRALHAIHRKMRRGANAASGSIDRIVYCPHVPDDHCDCRKPLPGLLVRLARHYGVTLAGVPVIGDSERDIAAAWAVDARPILVLTGNGARTHGELLRQGRYVECYPDLLAAATALVKETGPAERT